MAIRPRTEVNFSFEGAPPSYNADSRTLTVQWLSRQDHVRQDWDGNRYILRLHAEGCDLSRANAGGPFKFLHSVFGQSNIIGNLVPGTMTLGTDFRGFADVRLIDFADDESDTDDDKRAAMKVAKGYIRPISMDALITESSIEEFPDSDQMPIVHALKWEVAALSVVAIQQDPGALTMEAQTMADKTIPAVPEKPAVPEPVAAPDPAAVLTEQFTREDEVNDLAVVFSLDPAEAKKIARSREPLDKVRARLISEKAAKGDALAINSSFGVEVDEADTVKRGILEMFEARFGGKEPSERAKPYAGRNFDHIARTYFERTGIIGSIAGMDDATIRQRALGFGAGGALSPSDLPVLMTEGVNRVVNRLAAEAPPMNIEPLLKDIKVDDFRDVKMVRRLLSGTIKEIATNGAVEYPFVLDETFETAAVKDWGGGIQIGRRASIDDDLRQLDDLPAEMIRVTREHQIDRFWDVFLTGTLRDGYTVAHASHNNIVASGGAGPGTLEQLSKMRLLFKRAVDGETKLRARMTHLIVPEILYDEAAQIVNGTMQANEASKTIPPDYRGLGIISDTALDDNSAVMWYAAAAAIPCFARILKRGEENPVVMSDRVFETRGLKIAVFFPYNIVPIAYQGIARNKGAA